jgi:hypothetical protein
VPTDVHSAAALFGFAGDGLTFCGGLILAIDAARQEKRFRKMRGKVHTYLAPEFLRLKVEEEGVLITDEKDIELTFIRHSVWWAKVGTVLLTVGFTFLLITRSLEWHVNH